MDIGKEIRYIFYRIHRFYAITRFGQYIRTINENDLTFKTEDGKKAQTRHSILYTLKFSTYGAEKTELRHILRIWNTFFFKNKKEAQIVYKAFKESLYHNMERFCPEKFISLKQKGNRFSFKVLRTFYETGTLKIDTYLDENGNLSEGYCIKHRFTF